MLFLPISCLHYVSPQHPRLVIEWSYSKTEPHATYVLCCLLTDDGCGRQKPLLSRRGLELASAGRYDDRAAVHDAAERDDDQPGQTRQQQIVKAETWNRVH